MAKYLLVESRDPLESSDVGHYYELAAGLARDGHEVTLFLVQNGVFPARRSKASDRLKALAEAGVKILADDFSLRERGIAGGLAPGVNASPIDVVVDRMADGTRTIWH